jgi:phosphoglycerol transferase MdoB-like AlkP superfamily enzyme
VNEPDPQPPPAPAPGRAPPRPRAPPASLTSPLRRFLAPFKLPLVLLAAHFALFSLARLALLAIHRGDFSPLPAGEILRAFLRGLRFDGGAIFPVIGLPLFLLMLPFPRTRRLLWQRIWGWTCCAAFAAFMLLLAGDTLYFGHVHRHAGLEATEPGEALKILTASALFQYLLPLLGCLAASIGLFFAGLRLLRAEPAASTAPAGQLALALGLAVLMYFGERGTLTGKRLRIVHAFQNAPAAAAHLALNGPYCILHSLYHAHAVPSNFYPWPEALATAQGALFAPGERAGTPEYPLLRSRAARDAGRPNVVVILLESWDASATDAHRREMGMPPLGCTPEYDAAARDGVLYSRFHACGQRSMDGISAMLCGFPTLPGTPYLGRGLEQSSLSGLGNLARREGYDTWYIQSSERDAFRMDAIAGMTGFAHYVGAEDIPPSPPAVPRSGLRGASWDHEMFAEAGRRLSTAKPPFLAFLYTSTTHYPFAWPEEKWRKRTGETHEARYLNSLEYGDWALGRFFQEAKASEWFDRTIFIVTSDHIGGPGYGVKQDDPSTLHHTPCFIRAPGLKPGVDRRIGSQLDLIPTIVDLAGWSGPQAALGTTLFADPAAGRGALCIQGDLLLRVEEGGFVLHSQAGRVSGKAAGGSGELDAIERRLLSVTQAAYTLLRSNRLAR